MKAVICPRYGSPDVLRIEEVAAPEPKRGEVQVEVAAASVNAADWHMMRGEPYALRLAFGLRRPKHSVLGLDIAGTVTATGSGVSDLEPGDEVFADLSSHGFGGFAEQVCAPETAFAPMPEGSTFVEAAAVPTAGLTALQGLRDKGRIRKGAKVLVTGASGGVGSFAVQLAKSLGAEVTGVCSGAKAQFVRSLGADQVIDYEREDFAKLSGVFDLVLDAGAFRSVFQTRRTLRKGGRYVFVGGAGGPMLQAMLLGRSMLAKSNRKDLLSLARSMESGKLRPQIDRTFPLEEAPNAIRYLEEGRARGKVVVIVRGDASSRTEA